jgi:hypothetical protein
MGLAVARNRASRLLFRGLVIRAGRGRGETRCESRTSEAGAVDVAQTARVKALTGSSAIADERWSRLVLDGSPVFAPT